MAQAANTESWAELEQVVYGSFPDLPSGQQIRFKTAGISPPIASAIVTRCDNWGEIRSRVFTQALVGLGLPAHVTRGAGPLFMVDGITNLGVDSAGRPGAQMHHVLVMTPDEYRLFGADPFLVAEQGALASRWDPARFEGAARVRVPDMPRSHAAALAHADRTSLAAGLRLARLVLEKQGCLFWTEEQSEHLRAVMRLAWILLPVSVRMVTKLATFAFLNRNDFDLASIYSDLAPAGPLRILQPDVALQELTGQATDSQSYLGRIAMDLNSGRYERVVETVASFG